MSSDRPVEESGEVVRSQGEVLIWAVSGSRNDPSQTLLRRSQSEEGSAGQCQRISSAY